MGLVPVPFQSFNNSVLTVMICNSVYLEIVESLQERVSHC
jgi:hypothetical protein